MKWMIKLKALLILNGNIKDLNLLYKLGKESDFILCADGGANYAMKASLMPDMIIGDLDSISKNALKTIEENRIPIEKFPVKKDKTDAELAIDYIIKQGYKDLTIVGALGDRMDHTVGNILLLNKLNENNISGKIIDMDNIIYLVDKDLKLDKEKNTFISLIPVTNNGVVITSKGLEYELSKRNISFGSTLGISNSVREEQGYILVHEGQCLVIISKD